MSSVYLLRKAGQRPALPQALLLLAVAAPLAAAPATFATRVAPILEKHCVVCHGAEKQKAKLRLDGYAATLKGGDAGAVVKPRDVKDSELYRRITLPKDHEDVMPSDGKPLLAQNDIAVIEKWIAAGAPETAEFDAPAPVVAAMLPPAAPDYRSRLAQATQLADTLGVKLVPRSRVATDGFVLRTASAPAQCNDATLAKLVPVADLIVEAELARTKITDAGLRAVASWPNLQRLDLTRTAVTSTGVAALKPLAKLESLNLTDTKVDDQGVAALRTNPRLGRIWTFGTPAAAAP
jgi:mono/diheme cytochrome c family protein